MEHSCDARSHNVPFLFSTSLLLCALNFVLTGRGDYTYFSLTLRRDDVSFREDFRKGTGHEWEIKASAVWDCTSGFKILPYNDEEGELVLPGGAADARPTADQILARVVFQLDPVTVNSAIDDSRFAKPAPASAAR